MYTSVSVYPDIRYGDLFTIVVFGPDTVPDALKRTAERRRDVRQRKEMDDSLEER